MKGEVRCDGFDEQVHWYALGIHAEIVEKLAETLDLLYNGKLESAETLLKEVFLMAQESEKTLGRTFDVKTFVFIWQIVFDSIKQGTAAIIQD